MLCVNKLTDYATLILSYLALNFEPIASSSTLARISHLAEPTVSKLLKMLARAGLVQAQRGASGGYRLARPARAISLLDVIEAIEGGMAMTACCDTAKAQERGCAVDFRCIIKDNWQAVNDMLFKTFAAISIADMIRPQQIRKARKTKKAEKAQKTVTLQDAPISVVTTHDK